MEISGQSTLLPVDNIQQNGRPELLDQSRKDYTAPAHSTRNGCCRLCLKGNCHLQKLFPGGYTEDVLISKIFECTTVEITFETDPDALICYSCVAKIEEFHRYREQCRSNDVQHKNSLRRAEVDQIHTATTSALLPAKYIKKEIDSEGFEISASDFFPIDATEPSSYGAFEASLDAPIARVADSSGVVVDSTIPNENGVLNDSDEDDDANPNLLELMPERTHGGFTISYTNANDEYDNNNEVVCEMPIKEEPQDFDDDDTGGPWNDYGMDDDDRSMDHPNSASLVPLIEDCSYSSDSEPQLTEVVQHPYREVYNDNGLVCIMQDGFLYVQKSSRNTSVWRCRVQGCAAETIRYADRKQLELRGLYHDHSREVRNTATDDEILRLFERDSDDEESFHYVRNVRRGNSIVYQGYKYCMKHTNVDGTTYWKCRHKNGSCTAALYQSPNNKFTTVGNHTHPRQLSDDGLPNSMPTQPSYVTSVSTEEEGSPPKITLRIARQTATTKGQTSPEKSNPNESKQIPTHPVDTLPVIKSGYGHKIVKNTNGRTRLYFDGNLYVREASRKEASGAVVVQWRCRRNYDMCGVRALQHEDGLVEVLGVHDHTSIKKAMKIPENAIPTRAYEMLPTAKGGETMVLDGYRYVQAYLRPDGMSLWRCVGVCGIICRVKITLTTDGIAYVTRNATHSHEKPQNVKSTISKPTETSVSRTRSTKADDGADKKVFRPTAVTTESDKTLRKAYEKSVPATTAIVPSQTVKATSKSQPPVRNYRVIRNKKGHKALVHAGYRYCRIRTRQDGSVSWLCKMNKKTCRVPVYEHPDGRLEWTSHRRHNHGPTDPIDPPKKQPQVSASPPSTPAQRGKRTEYHIDDDTFVNNEWFFVRNHKNGTTLIHAGHRYHRKGKRVNDTSMWRCARACHGCRAAIVLHPDETIAKFDDIDHNHPPPNTAMEEMEVIVGDPDESLERKTKTSTVTNITDNVDDAGTEPTPEPELSLVRFNGCIEEQDDPEANMRSLLNTMLMDVSDEAVNNSFEKVIVPASKAHYKYVTNRRHTKSLVFRGFRYARASTGVRSDGSVRWTCQMNKKTCRVTVRILKDGSVEMNGQKHNHPQLPEDIENNYENDEDDDEDVDELNDTNNESNNPADENDDNEENEKEAHYFALNRSNGKSLIYQRNRFSRENVRPDGSTTWRCMMRTDCLVKVVLLRNNTCHPYRVASHNHPPLDVLPEPLYYPEKRSTTKLIVKGDMLLYKQNRMKKTKSFSDGTALFKCTEVVGCTGMVKIRYDETEHGASSPVVVFDSPHNHSAILAADAESSIESDTKPTTGGGSGGGKSKRKSPVKLLKYSPTTGVDNRKEYQLFRNDRGQVSLVYKGFRYSLRNLNAAGDSSWKCRSNRMCCAYVTFTKDGQFISSAGKGEPKLMPHNHPVNGEYIERAVPLELDQLHPPAHDLRQFVSNWIKGLYKNELGRKATLSPKSSTITHHTNNERKSTIFHKNYSYKLQTTKNGREFWRCTMFKARACRAGLFCKNNGAIIQYENGREHNHEPAKPLASSIEQQSITSPRKALFSSGSAKGKTNNGAYSPLSGVKKSIKRSESALPFDEQQSADETVTPLPYQIVKRDGIDTLLYERHRYAVSFSKREESTDSKEPKRWRCCLWNSRHQCPVELTILPTNEIHFVTDPTHNHRPPPPDTQESLDHRQSAVGLSVKGTKKYEMMGRYQKTVFYKGHKYSWQDERNGSTYYRCTCYSTHDCGATVKIDTNGLLYECSAVSHNHSPELDTSTDAVPRPPKPMTVRNVASRQTRLDQCSKTGSSDYRFVRSCLGNSMIFEGHRYWLHSKLSCGLNVYRCRYQKQKECSGSVYMDAETRLLYHRYDAEHNHEPLEEDAVAGIEQDTTVNASLNVSELNDSSANADTIDEQETDTSSSNNNLPKTAIVPKKEVIITNDYSFVKDSLNRNQLFYDQYVFEMVPLQYRKNGDKFYSCLFADCSAAVKLLTSGGLDISKPIHHAHEQPDLTDYRDVGRGSSDFVTLSSSTTAPGTATPMIMFEGYQYCVSASAADSQPSPDGTKLFHCQEKNRTNGRCSAMLEMLPNGRVIVTGTHHHPKPNLNPESEDAKEKTQSNILVLGGRSYAYLETQPDGTGVWKCTDDPKCMAKVYKKPNGKLVYGTVKHVLRHLMPKLPTPSHTSSVAPKVIAPTTTTSTAGAASLSSSINFSSGSIARTVSSGNLRTKWYKGNRYNFYLTRSDGVQYWRCSKRMEDKCEAGIHCQPDGTVAPANQWPHTHPPLNPSALGSSERVQQEQPVVAEYKVKQLPESNDDSKPNVKVKTNHAVRITPDASDMFIWFKGVQYSLRHRRSDGIRIYRCRNKPCTHSLVVTKRGKIISKKTTWHSCESKSSSEDSKGKELVPWTNNSTSGLGFDKPEIEDPDDLDDHNDSTDIQPMVKRVRLDSSSAIEMVPENKRVSESESILQTTDSLPNFDTESDAEREVEPLEESHGGLLPIGTTSNAWDDEPEYIMHEFATIDTNDDNNEADAEDPPVMGDGTQDEQVESYEELAAAESFAGSLTCHDATNI